MDQADAAVWQEVCRLLENPERLEQEYRQRLHPQQRPKEHEGLEAQMSKLHRGIARLIDSYAEVKEGLHHADFQRHAGTSFVPWSNGLKWMSNRSVSSFASVRCLFHLLQTTPLTIGKIVEGVYTPVDSIAMWVQPTSCSQS